MPRYLFAIPHYFNRKPEGKWHGSESGNEKWRRAALINTVTSLHQTFGRRQCMMQLDRRESDAANQSLRGDVTVFICTSGQHHLLHDNPFPPGLVEQITCHEAPQHLGYACHRVLHENRNKGDWFGYLEDDLLLHDSLFFNKVKWFAEQAGADALLLPNRYEVTLGGPALRAYIDGDLREGLTADWQDRTQKPSLDLESLGCSWRFIRPANPHAGCFFLNADQLQRWAKTAYFLDQSEAFVGPLESAATLGIMRTFRIYKPAIENAGFLEVQHQSNQFIRQLRPRSEVD